MVDEESVCVSICLMKRTFVSADGGLRGRFCQQMFDLEDVSVSKCSIKKTFVSTDSGRRGRLCQ